MLVPLSNVQRKQSRRWKIKKYFTLPPDCILMPIFSLAAAFFAHVDGIAAVEVLGLLTISGNRIRYECL